MMAALGELHTNAVKMFSFIFYGASKMKVVDILIPKLVGICSKYSSNIKEGFQAVYVKDLPARSPIGLQLCF